MTRPHSMEITFCAISLDGYITLHPNKLNQMKNQLNLCSLPVLFVSHLVCVSFRSVSFVRVFLVTG